MRTATIGTGDAHGTAILVGEHTVGYGMPAIAVPLPGLPVHARAAFDPDAGQPDSLASAGFEFRFAAGGDTRPRSGPEVAVAEALRGWDRADEVVHVAVRCAVPPSPGLGATAACAAAAVTAVADLCDRPLDPAALHELVRRGESVQHGHAGALDAWAAAAPGPVWFECGGSHPLPLRLNAVVVIADTGAPDGGRRAVQRARGELERDPVRAGRLLARAAFIANGAARDLAAGRAPELGERLTDFHTVLDDLGVSTAALDRMVAIALAAGALGAKLTGGGLGGCVLALAERPSNAERVSNALLRAGAKQTWTVMTGGWAL